ncbi:MAG: dienelactone hydrolase family protein [Micromonosporaceae bacterium]
MLQTELTITADDVQLPAELVTPDAIEGIIAFAHGSGSGRRSPRNTWVAEQLHAANFGTLLFDLLSAEEARIDSISSAYRFDAPFLGGRLVNAVDWLTARPEAADQPIGVFGASTGAAAALIAAARRPEAVRAVVSRGGRPDLAAPLLGGVSAPVLLIVGSRDQEVLKLNRQAQAALAAAHSELREVPGAGHLFEDPGAMDKVVSHTVDWFTRHLR